MKLIDIVVKDVITQNLKRTTFQLRGSITRFL